MMLRPVILVSGANCPPPAGAGYRSLNLSVGPFFRIISKGADKSLAFPISYLQRSQKKFSWMG
jgi:hypothetical protein